jgi:signal transduction histidine kinase
MVADPQLILDGLQGGSRAELKSSISAALHWLANASVGDERVDDVCAAIAALGAHAKWEVRRAVAVAAGRHSHQAFDVILAALHDDDHAQVAAAAQDALMKRADRSRRSVYGDQHGRHVDELVARADATQNRRGRAAIRKVAANVANAYASEVHHEMVKLLSPLGLAVERLRLQTEAGSPSLDDVRVQVVGIQHLVERLGGVLRGMREYAQNPVLSFETISLGALLRDAVDIVAVRSTNAIGVAFSLDETQVEADRSRLLQAFVNLITNAAEAYDAKSGSARVEITCALTRGIARVEVRDYGCGMSAEAVRDARRLFVTTKLTGTGFGLPLAMKVIEEEHGGRIEIASKEDHGTTVTVSLPSTERRGRP